MIKGFTTPVEGDKDTWPPEGWVGTIRYKKPNDENWHYVDIASQVTGHFSPNTIWQWLDETPCTEQVRELLEKYKSTRGGWFNQAGLDPEIAEKSNLADPLIQTVEKLLK